MQIGADTNNLDEEMAFNNDNHQDAEPMDVHDPIEHHPEQPPFDTGIQVETALLCILKDVGAPLETFHRVMEWAARAVEANYHFMPKRTKYHDQIKHLERVLGMQDLRPMQNPIFLEGHEQPQGTVSFNFVAHLKSLLSDPELNKMENLVVNPHDRFAPFQANNSPISEVLTGSWCKHAVETMVTNPQMQFCCPLILTTDKTNISEQADCNSHPVFFTLAIFN